MENPTINVEKIVGEIEKLAEVSDKACLELGNIEPNTRALEETIDEQYEGKRYRGWSFTYWWETEEDIKNITAWMDHVHVRKDPKTKADKEYKRTKIYAINREVTPTTDKNHLQGYFELINGMNLKQLLSSWEKFGISLKNKNGKNKIRFSRNNNQQKAIAYCQKEETREDGTKPITKNARRPLIDPLKGFEYRPYQKDINKIVNPNIVRRKVIWIYDRDGNKGKSDYIYHLTLKFPNNVVLADGSIKDVGYYLQQKLQDEPEFDPYIVFFDFVRSKENYISYEGIEKIKNGLMFSSKYDSGKVQFNPPQLVVFANFEPDLTRLSADRWEVWEINNDFELVLRWNAGGVGSPTILEGSKKN